MNQQIVDEATSIIFLKGEVPKPNRLIGNVEIELRSPAFRSSGYPVQPPQKSAADDSLRRKAISMGANVVGNVQYSRKQSHGENVLRAQGIAVSAESEQIKTLVSDAEESEDQNALVFTEEILLDEMRRSGWWTIFGASINSLYFFAIVATAGNKSSTDTGLATLLLVGSILILLLGIGMVLRKFRDPAVLMIDSVLLIILGLGSRSWLGVLLILLSIQTIRSFRHIGKEIEQDKAIQAVKAEKKRLKESQTQATVHQ